MKINNKFESKLNWDGVLLKKGDKEKLIQIEGDKIEDAAVYSILQGVAKGFGTLIAGAYYPFIAGALKAKESYHDVVESTIKDMNESNKKEIVKSGLKGAFIGGIKGTLHGFFDSAVILGLTSFLVATTGPNALVLTPFIGAIYNFIKDNIRITNYPHF